MNESYFNYYASSRRAIAEAMGLLSTVESKFIIRFKNYDGSILLTVYAGLKQPVAYTGETPIRPEDEQYIYTFKGWDKEIVKATKDEVYTATFDAEEKGPAVVDLGLSVKWAKYNLGASSETELGNLYAWGEVGIKDHYDYDNYKYLSNVGTEDWKYTKYNSDDNLTILLPEDDAATYNLNSDWRMPTCAEMEELLDTTKVTNSVVTKDGVQGYEFTSIVPGYEGNKIFIPMQDGDGYVGATYWSSERTMNEDRAYVISLNSDYEPYIDDECARYYGVFVRPVYDPS